MDNKTLKQELKRFKDFTKEVETKRKSGGVMPYFIFDGREFNFSDLLKFGFQKHSEILWRVSFINCTFTSVCSNTLSLKTCSFRGCKFLDVESLLSFTSNHVEGSIINHDSTSIFGNFVNYDPPSNIGSKILFRDSKGSHIFLNQKFEAHVDEVVFTGDINDYTVMLFRDSDLKTLWLSFGCVLAPVEFWKKNLKNICKAHGHEGYPPIISKVISLGNSIEQYNNYYL